MNFIQILLLLPSLFLGMTLLYDGYERKNEPLHKINNWWMEVIVGWGFIGLTAFLIGFFIFQNNTG